MTDKGAGIMLRSGPRTAAIKIPGTVLTFAMKAQIFTSNDVCDKFYRILTEPSFKDTMMRMKVASRPCICF